MFAKQQQLSFLVFATLREIGHDPASEIAVFEMRDP
jgi:hypothetical protein